MDCFGTYLTHAQSCDNVRVHSATEWTASVHTLRMPKAVITFVFIQCYAMDCFGTYFTHAQSCDNVHVQSATGRTASVHTHAQSCDNVHVQSATDWAASVHTLHMPKAVIKFVFEVYGMDCWRTYLHMPKSVITFVFKVLRNGLCFRRFRVFAVFAFSFFPVSVLGVFAFSRFRVPPAAPPRPGHRFRVHREDKDAWDFDICFFSPIFVRPATSRVQQIGEN